MAASSAWYDAQGAQIKLVVDDVPDKNGVLRGAILVDLKPGWKTYWRDPGDAGVPPSLNISGSANATDAVLHYPPPVRFDEAGAWSIGYKKPVALAFTAQVQDTTKPVDLKTIVFLGVCKETCIPVQTEFELLTNPAVGMSEADVSAAFAALPLPATADLRLTTAHLEGETLIVDADLPAPGANAELFAASAHGWYLDVPLLESGPGGKPRFRIRVFERPKQAAGGEIAYTLISNDRAVEGTFSLPE